MWLNEKQCTVSLYDTAGQQDYEAVRAFTYHQSDVIVMCFSMADRESLQNVQDVWVTEIRRYIGNKKQIILVIMPRKQAQNSAYIQTKGHV